MGGARGPLLLGCWLGGRTSGQGSKREQAFNQYQSKVKGILNVIFPLNDKKQFNGNGYFVLEDYASGEALVKLEGEKYEGREVYLNVPDVEELIQDPVENE